ncbi:putative hemolysin [Bacteroidales bacterium Barb4]|nr:putative hemolysin [Bacteroidales bacterium Barb4]
METFIIIGLILLNGLLSMFEIALVSARKSRLEIDAKKGSTSARRALELADEPDKFLSAIQIGITLVGILTGLYSGQAFAADAARMIEQIPALQPYSLLIAKTGIVIIVTYLTLIFGELVPKRIGMSFAEQVSKLAARPMTVLSALGSPFVWLLSRSTTLVVNLLGLNRENDNHVTEEEIKAIVKEGLSAGEVQEVEQDIVERVFNLGDRDITSIMTHRNELVWLDVTDSPDKIREKVQEFLFNIYPVASGKLDNLLGVVFLKDLFLPINTPGFSLEPLIRPAEYLPENQSVYAALSVFKQTRAKYGIVTDEFGGIQGIVTLKDIMEGLIGQFPEAGEELDITERADGTWLVDGQLSFYDFLAHFDMEDLYTGHEFNTLSGLILEKLQHLPHAGETLSWYSLDLEILDMDGARIDKVLVKKRIE